MWIQRVFSDQTVKTIKEDLINVIADENGTGHSIYHENIQLAGKTSLPITILGKSGVPLAGF